MSTYIDQVRSGETSLQYIPRKEKTHAICLAAVHRDGAELYHVPQHLRSQAVCFTAVHQAPDAIRHLSVEFLDAFPDLVDLAVSRKGTLLEWVARHAPAHLRRRVVEKAINSYGYAIQWAPADLLDKDLVRLAVSRDGRVLHALGQRNLSIVKDLIPEICIKHLPDEFKTYDACLNQVASQGRLLQYVPLRLIDEALVEAALRSNPWALEFVPATFASSPAVEAAIASGDAPAHMAQNIGLRIA